MAPGNDGFSRNEDGSFRALTWSGLIGLQNNLLLWAAHQEAMAQPGELIEYLQLGVDGRESEWLYVAWH